MITNIFNKLFNLKGGKVVCDEKKIKICKSKGKTCNIETGRCNKIYEEKPKKKRGRPKKVKVDEPKQEPKKEAKPKQKPKKGKCTVEKFSICRKNGKICNPYSSGIKKKHAIII